jgi:hypothetical protein
MALFCACCKCFGVVQVRAVALDDLRSHPDLRRKRRLIAGTGQIASPIQTCDLIEKKIPESSRFRQTVRVGVRVGGCTVLSRRTYLRLLRCLRGIWQ